MENKSADVNGIVRRRTLSLFQGDLKFNIIDWVAIAIFVLPFPVK